MPGLLILHIHLDLQELKLIFEILHDLHVWLCLNLLVQYKLEHLLLDLVRGPLVMTSGNRSEEPIAITNEQARDRLR